MFKGKQDNCLVIWSNTVRLSQFVISCRQGYVCIAEHKVNVLD